MLPRGAGAALRAARALLRGGACEQSGGICGAQAHLGPALAGAQLRGCAGAAGAPEEPAQFRVLAAAAGGGPIRREPVYAVFELGASQYKVSAGDLVYTERLRGADVGSCISLDRVQLAGSAVETVVGRPYVQGAAVTAVVEEQVQDAKVTSFKKRRRKNSRRIKGHRQLLTGLRITGVQGIAVPPSAGAAPLVIS